ncbi:hypothetical protein [Thermoanaerobacterium sp. RBIITD]|uniref:peptidase MA family metallohydrolase n=1 Tax=Thermoanaerobacterium sp. RBIITD TaxID=1550240 RepID=UPI000BB71F48|nr:hypothetical protein [Thermoanaerobacterium sp. RBIITD]SNX53721.1 hypothetical protein SAMN05660242_1296 [Thermoanaerobacterium sp. RBIITD]
MRNRNIVIVIFALFILSFILNGSLLSKAYPVYKIVGRDKIENSIKDYKTAESKHFIIRYTEADKKYVGLIINTAEKHYYDISKDLGYMPKNKSTIIVYKNPDEMNKDFSLAKGENAMGIYLNGVISIESPSIWITPDQDLNRVFQNEGPVVHEFTHLIVDDIAKGNYPVWFTEGIALLEEYRQDGYEWGKDLTYSGRPYTYEELKDDFNSLDEMLAYKRAFQVTKAISDKYGMETIREMLKDLGSGMNIEDSFYKETDTKLDIFVNNVKE